MKKGKVSTSTHPKAKTLTSLPKLARTLKKSKGSSEDKSNIHILNLLQSISLNPRLDKATGERMSVLIKEYDSLSSKLHEGEKRMHELKITLRSLSESITETRKKVGGGTEFEKQEVLYKKVLTLENRLETSHKKINQLTLANRRCEEEIESCVSAENLFKKMVLKMKKELKKKKNQIKVLMEKTESVIKKRQVLEKDLKLYRGKMKKVEKNFEKKAKVMDGILQKDQDINEMLKRKQGLERNTLEKKTLLMEGKKRKDEKYKKELFDILSKVEVVKSIEQKIASAIDHIKEGVLKDLKEGLIEVNKKLGFENDAQKDVDVLANLKSLERSIYNLSKLMKTGNK